MSLVPGTRLGPYEVIAPIGEGGMGQVYRARDTRLHRDVALKIIPDVLANDPDRVARFEREARTLASLSHTNIAAIYGLEGRALVMELVEGEDLSALIAAEGGESEAGGRAPRGLNVGDAISIAKQIADALEAAHERGIVHRDLKPANVKVRDDGTVKVLDFGLAKALDSDAGRGLSAGEGGDPANSPTFTNRGTELGMILGTAAYMSPEQARGRPVDRRADIWAFGVVLYEMLAGRRAFAGVDVSITLANVLKEDVDWSALPSSTPPSIRNLIERCLEKDPKKRLGWIGEARYVLDQPAPSGVTRATQPMGHADGAPPARAWLPWTLAVIAAAAAVATLAAWSPWRAAPVAAHPRKLLVDIGVDGSIESLGMSASAILSPDGRTLVFVAGQAGRSALFVRQLDQLTAQKIEGTDGAYGPFFSPRGDWIGYFTQSQLKKVPVSGGASVPLAAASSGRGAAWLEDDTIVFSPSPSPGRALMRMPASGGNPEPFSTLSEGAQAQRWPQALPGGTHVLFSESAAAIAITLQDWDTANLLVQPVAGGPAKVVVRGGHYGRFVASRSDPRRGHLLYVHRGVIWAAPFDLAQMAVTAPAFQAITGVLANAATGAAQFHAAADGTLVYLPGTPSGSSAGPILWLTADGQTTPLRETPAQWSDPSISPDGTRLAVTISDGTQSDIWIHEFSLDRATRLTLDAAVDRAAVWSPDSQRIAFASDRAKPGGPTNLYVANADGSGAVTRLTESDNQQTPQSWHPTANEILFSEVRRATLVDMLVLPLTIDPKAGSISGGAPRTFLETPSNEGAASISPDGRWVAYTSNPGGIQLPDAYVRPYSGSGGPWQITTEGCVFPQWVRKAAEVRCLSFRSGRIMAIPYSVAGDSFRADNPRVWAPVTYRPANITIAPLAVHPDGLRVAVGRVTANTDQLDRIVLFLNFPDYLAGLAK